MSLLPHFERPVRAIDLEQPRRQGMPVLGQHRPGHAYFLHRRHEDTYRPEVSPRSSAAGVIVCMEHSGTHIDALCHQAEDLRLFGGVPVADAAGPAGFSRLGVEEIPPIVARGVLLDVAAHRGVEELPAGEAVGREELEACALALGVGIGRGDVVLVRTGNDRNWADADRYLAGAGMAGSASAWLAELGVVAVGADNIAWDVLGLRDPDFGLELPGHLVLLARSGIYILENLALAELAAAGRPEFTFVCAPLKVVGATGSPVRPIALVAA
jgi:kynurenine formamidase